MTSSPARLGGSGGIFLSFFRVGIHTRKARGKGNTMGGEGIYWSGILSQPYISGPWRTPGGGMESADYSGFPRSEDETC
jgi:hypothetical protein